MGNYIFFLTISLMAIMLEEQKRPKGKEQKIFMEAGAGSRERRGELNRQKR